MKFAINLLTLVGTCMPVSLAFVIPQGHVSNGSSGGGGASSRSSRTENRRLSPLFEKPEDFAAGVIRPPLPFRGFPMPELPEEEEFFEEQEGPPEPEPAPKASFFGSSPKAAPAPAPAPAPVPAPVPAPAQVPAPAPAPVPAPEPVSSAPAASEATIAPETNLSPVPAPSPPPATTAVAAPPAPRLKPAVTVERSTDAITFTLPKKAAAAPLILVPVIALVAGRQIMAQRKERLEELEAQLAKITTDQKKELGQQAGLATSLFALAAFGLIGVLGILGGG